MPLTPDLDSYLDRILQRHRLPGRYSRQYQPLPEATRQFPKVKPEAVYQRAVERQQDRGFWETAFDIIRSGEYAVSSFLRSVIRGDRRRTDPLTALWKGFTSSFTNNAEYKTTMEDVFKVAGWRPEPGTVEAFGKNALAFATGILLDPLTYLTIGPAARALRIGGKTLQETAERFGIKGLSTLKGFKKGQALSKQGRSVYSSLKTTAAVTEPLTAESRALSDVTRLIYPNELLPGKLLTQVKPDNLVSRVLLAQGKKATQKAIQEFREVGYRELLDPGGLKWMGKVIKGPAAGFLTPRASSLHGLILGESIASNMPLMSKIGRRIKETKTWQEVVSPRIEKFLSLFTRFRGMAEHEKDLMIKFRQATQASQQLVEEATDNLAYYDTVGSRTITTKGLGIEVPLRVTETKKLGKEQMDFVATALIEAQSPQAQGQSLEEFLYNIMNGRSDRLPGLQKMAQKVGLEYAPESVQQGVMQIASRTQKLLQGTRQWALRQGLEIPEIPAYFPRRVKLTDAARKKLTPRQLETLTPAGNWYFQKHRTSRYGYFETKDLLAKGSPEVLGELDNDYHRVVKGYLSDVFARAYQEDALEAFVDVARVPALRKELQEFLQKNPHLLEKDAVIGQAILQQSTPQGIPKKALQKFRTILNRMEETHDPEAIKKMALKLVQSPSSKDLSEYNVNALMDMYRGVMKRKEAMLQPPTGASDVLKIQSGLRKMSELESTVNTGLNRKLLDTRIREIGKRALKAQKYLGVKPPGFGGLTLGVTKRGGKVTSHYTVPAPHMPDAFERTAERVAEQVQLDPRYRVQEQFTARTRGKEVGRLKAETEQISQRLKGLEEGTRKDYVPTYHAAEASIKKQDAAIERLNTEISNLKKTYADPGRRATRAARLLSELETRIDIRKQLPGADFLGRIKKVARAQEHIDEITKTKNVIKKAGAENHLSAILHRFYGKTPLEKLSPEKIRRIRKTIQTAPNNPQAARRLLSPTEFDMRKANIPSILKVTDPITGKRVPFNELAISTPMAQELERSMNPKRMGALNKFLQKIQAPFKKLVTSTTLLGLARPAFFVRNLVDLSFRGTLMAGSRFWAGAKENFGDAVKLLTRRDGNVIIDGIPLSYQHLREKLVDGDLFRRGFEAIDVRAGGFKPVEKLLKLWDEGKFHSYRDFKNRMHRELDKIPYLRRLGPERLGSYMENVGVVHGLISQLRAGIPIDNALQNLRRYLFSYNQLTDFEKNTLRSLVPFYSFSRQAVPMVGKVIAHRPALMAMFPKIADMGKLTAEEKAVTPEWLTNYPHVKIGTTPKGFSMVSMRNVFTLDIFPDIMPKLSFKGFKQFISQLNPIVIAPLEMILGKDLYLNRPTHPDVRKRLFKGLESEAVRGSPLGSWLEAREIQLKDKKYIAVDAFKHHMLTRMWFSRMFNELDQMSSIVEKKISSKGLWGLLTGFKWIEIDLERQRRILEAESEYITRKYNTALKRGDDVEARDILEEYRLK